ncbi:protein FAM32A-like [Tupaia chinensis]|uniref:protein FAM32A-like n=1 Tax=Tupaia chinensis TaxID=246437 RepID=UPI0003C91F50|nr:protein FAM32A-like [Tupaia chinensis]
MRNRAKRAQRGAPSLCVTSTSPRRRKVSVWFLWELVVEEDTSGLSTVGSLRPGGSSTGLNPIQPSTYRHSVRQVLCPGVTEEETEAEYRASWRTEQVQNGPLKLKGVAELSVTKRKKKKEKDKAKLLEVMGTSKKKEEKRRGLDKRTPVQAAFEKMQEKRQMERILKKASKTHKQRVEDFNRHLDTLMEYYDIPKVSWTK